MSDQPNPWQPTNRARHLEVRAPSLQRMVELCNEAIAKDWTWCEFLTKCRFTLNQETREIRRLERPVV